MPKKDRDWLLFTDEQPTVPVYPGYTSQEVRQALKRKEEPAYQGTFTSAKRHVLHTFANTTSPLMKKRVAQYMVSTRCPVCHGKRLRRESLSVKFAGSGFRRHRESCPLQRLGDLFRPYADGTAPRLSSIASDHPEKAIVSQRIAEDLVARLDVMLDLGLGYLTLERSTPTLSPGELQRLRLATQVRSNLFGVVYVLDEPSAGLHPVDTEALLRALDQLKAAGNSQFVVEHELDVIRHADWIVDVGPGAGEQGGHVLYSGPPEGLKEIGASQTRPYLFGEIAIPPRTARSPKGWLRLDRHHAQQPAPTGRRVSVGRAHHGDGRVRFRQIEPGEPGTGGTGRRSTLAMTFRRTTRIAMSSNERNRSEQRPHRQRNGGHQASGAGRSEADRADAALQPGDLYRAVRSRAQAFRRDPGRPARADMTQDGSRSMLPRAAARPARAKASSWWSCCFCPSVYAPCPTCHGTRYNAKTLEIKYRDKNIADVLAMTVDAAWEFFADEPRLHRSLTIAREVGLGYLRLGQPATELSGGEAQRIKLATELQRAQRGDTLYILDEPTTGLHPADVEKLVTQLEGLVEAGNTIIVVEHDMRVAARSDWVVDLGPGAGEDGGVVVASGPPAIVAKSPASRTAPYLALALGG